MIPRTQPLTPKASSKKKNEISSKKKSHLKAKTHMVNIFEKDSSEDEESIDINHPHKKEIIKGVFVTES